MHKSVKRFMIFGDSHVSFFSGEDVIVKDFKESDLYGMNFHIYHLGPVLAASLVERQSTLMAREKILNILSRENSDNWDGVILVFGEIDCRFHVIKRLGHKNAKMTPEVLRSINITVLRYFSFLQEVIMLGYKPIVWGPVASNCLVVTNPDWPNFGTMTERNIITQEFTKQMASFCKANGICLVSLLTDLLTDTMETKKEYYFDGGHLAQHAWSLALPLFLGHRQLPSESLDPQESNKGIDDNDIQKYLKLINQSRQSYRAI